MRSLTCIFTLLCFTCTAQLKFVVEDFEGFADGSKDLKANGVFTFGNIGATVDYKAGDQRVYSGERNLRLNRSGKQDFGGWGKGISQYVELDASLDYLDLFVYQPSFNDTNSLRIELQEDDNDDGTFTKELDDSWTVLHKLTVKGDWELISIPLNSFKDNNKGGDGIFNIGYKQGKLLCMVITFVKPPKINYDQYWSFDFICFSKGKLPAGARLFDAPQAAPGDLCALGAWSKEGNTANFTDIPYNFENNFKYGTDKKLGVVHFFQPFAFDGSNTQNLYPSVERINKVVAMDYVPMITLEDHFVNATPSTKQPNLYSIVEGHFDAFFAGWAKRISQVKGTVLLRILHEFNGDWYPWCIVNNDKDPTMLVKAYRHIHDIFKAQNVTNVKFIWCPNSTSFPQEKWNFIMDAYPGDAYVDYVALDIYNGAGKGIPVWRSFRKEGIENYFILTQRLPQKPLFICETASRERKDFESGNAQDKGGWIKQMSAALNTDMSKVRLLTWFNEKESFLVNSSQAAQGAFLNYVLLNEYFRSGTKDLQFILGTK